MGEVYRATDTTLNRQVAIKVLPESLASDAERIARFERKAKTLASLNHPRIAHICGFEQSSGVHALIMELVEGPTLADRTRKERSRLMRHDPSPSRSPRPSKRRTIASRRVIDGGDLRAAVDLEPERRAEDRQAVGVVRGAVEGIAHPAPSRALARRCPDTESLPPGCRDPENAPQSPRGTCACTQDPPQ